MSMLKKHKSFIKIFLLCVFCLFLGWILCLVYKDNQSKPLIVVRENSSKYNLINPLLLVDTSEDSSEYADLKKQIEKYISEAKSSKQASSISVYFRALNVSKWMGVKEDELYDPSSMLKVALMVGYLKQASDNPNLLLQNLTYTASNDPGQNYKPERLLPSGTYTIRELIQAMIIDSDNIAMSTLFNNNRDSFVDVFKNLNIPPPKSTDELDFMSPRTYSSIFRTLYSSTYLPRNVSEQALQLLTYTTFKKGLVAGLPENTVVAHKFGEHTDSVNNVPKSRQLHDCGIIYLPNNPYFLCVMTRGYEFSKLEPIIKDISSITFKNMTKQAHDIVSKINN